MSRLSRWRGDLATLFALNEPLQSADIPLQLVPVEDMDPVTEPPVTVPRKWISPVQDSPSSAPIGANGIVASKLSPVSAPLAVTTSPVSTVTMPVGLMVTAIGPDTDTGLSGPPLTVKVALPP
jgi:hypothetical protein